MTGIDVINLSIAVAGLFISFFGVLQVLMSPVIEGRTRTIFLHLFILILVYAAMSVCSQTAALRSGPALSGVQLAALFIESVLGGLLTVMLTGLLIYFSGEPDWRRNLYFRISAALFLVYFALLVYTQFSTVIYFIDEHNVYRRGPLYPLLLVPPMAGMLFNLVLFLRLRGKLTHSLKIPFILLLGIPILSILVQMCFYGLYTIVLGITASSFVTLLLILRDQTKKYLQEQQENERLKVDILLARIRPHFLYNSLLVIRQLCLTDSEAAASALDDFVRYLRYGMDSLGKNRTVPFREELEHTREYVRLQQLRFGSALEVEYDISCEDFSMPVLTLEPIVENAVKYGVRKTEDGRGWVRIRTEKTPEGYAVTVTDSGPGFIPESVPGDEDESHIGIQNVTERLRRIAGGDLRIQSVPGRGTAVTILLPEEGRE